MFLMGFYELVVLYPRGPNSKTSKTKYLVNFNQFSIKSPCRLPLFNHFFSFWIFKNSIRNFWHIFFYFFLPAINPAIISYLTYVKFSTIAKYSTRTIHRWARLATDCESTLKSDGPNSLINTHDIIWTWNWCKNNSYRIFNLISAQFFQYLLINLN